MTDDDVTRGCLLPIVQGATAFVIGFALAYGVARWQDWPAPGWISLILGAAASGFFWSTGVLIWRKDVYGDDMLQFRLPQKRTETVKVELTRPNDGPGYSTRFTDLDISPDQLEQLAVGLLSGTPFTEGAWTGTGRPFSRGQFSALRAEFFRQGWADWRNPAAPAQGVVLRGPGKAVLRTYASQVGALPRGVDRALSE